MSLELKIIIQYKPTKHILYINILIFNFVDDSNPRVQLQEESYICSFGIISCTWHHYKQPSREDEASGSKHVADVNNKN